MERTMAAGATKLTYDDLLRLFPEEDGLRHELIDGEHFVTPAPSLKHQHVLANLFRAVDRFVLEHALGRVYFAPLDVIFTEIDVAEPDLLYLSTELLAQVDQRVRVAPELLVEVLSPGSRRHDEVRKRDLYERTGVTEYWIVDPEIETVKVFRRTGNSYGRPALLSSRDGDVLRTDLLPGFEVALAIIFAP